MQDPSPAQPTWRRPLRYILWKWRQRHRHPANFAMHLVGIPMTVAGVVTLIVMPWHEWYWGAGLFVIGYVLQYVGHRIEGNDVGEWAAIKRLFGLPCVLVAPQYEMAPQNEHASPEPR